ncbi:MAG: M1 family metallopeptidase [Gemmatimonadales bacterium]
MSIRWCAKAILLAVFLAIAPSAPGWAQPAGGGSGLTRTIRRDVPLTNTIRRAFAAGTRDSTGRPGPRYWQLWTEYTIRARLDVATSMVSGQERIVIHNPSDSALRAIVLRLDQNIFRPNARRLSAIPSQVEITSGMRITRITVDGQPVNLSPPPPRPGANPAAGGPAAFGLDQTVASIALQSPVPGGGTATLEVEWSFTVPRVEQGRGLRMGRLADSLYQVAQWYPRVAKYDDLRGWDTEPYLGPSEFYNNFGRWEVSLDVPGGWIVGATGVLQNPSTVLSPATRERLARMTESDDQRTIIGPGESRSATASSDRLVWRFVADTANDFAWAASRSYVWDATRATIPGRGVIPVHILYLPGDTAFKRAGPIVRHALEFYSKLWMPYAFPQLTMADGPELGMEYPMFLMSGIGAADHETGHEWWPMMVGVNETWYGWMDEGFNQYMNILSAADRRGQPANLDGRGQQYGQISGQETESPMMWPANYQGQFYSFTTYGKAPQMLSMLGGIVGDSAVQRATSEYARAWRFKHPSPWDYMFSMNRALGQDLNWFWYYWLFTTEAVHGSIQALERSGTRMVVTVRQDGEMPAPVVLQIQFAPQGPLIKAMTNSRMTDSLTAVVTWPVEVWFGGSRSFRAELDFGGREITRIVLDPFRRFPDRDPSDNVWPRSR